LKQIMAKAQKAPGTAEGSSVGGDLNIWKPSTGQVLDGDYVDYQLASWDRSQGIDIELTTEDGESVELFISPYSRHQRARPREDEHIWGDFGDDSTKTIKIHASNVELENAEALYVSVHGRAASEAPSLTPHKYSLQFKSLPKQSAGSSSNPIALDDPDTEMHSPDEEQCKISCVPIARMFSKRSHEHGKTIGTVPTTLLMATALTVKPTTTPSPTHPNNVPTVLTRHQISET
jgi:hypothetical protein